MTTLYYEIRIAGALPPEVLIDFERLTSVQEVETVLHGPLPDQAALHGLLARLETFGAEVLEVRRLRGVAPLAAAVPGDPTANDAAPGRAEPSSQSAADGR